MADGDTPTTGRKGTNWGLIIVIIILIIFVIGPLIVLGAGALFFDKAVSDFNCCTNAQGEYYTTTGTTCTRPGYVWTKGTCQ